MKKIQELSDLNILHQASKRLHDLSSINISTQYNKFFHPLKDILTEIDPKLNLIVHTHYDSIMVSIYEYRGEGKSVKDIDIQDFQIKKISDDAELKVVKAVEDFLTSIK